MAREEGTGKVVGFGLRVTMRISWSGQQRSALIGMNFLVDQAYRRQKISETMHTMQIEEGKKRGYAFIYGCPNAHLLPVLRRKGHRTVRRIPLVIRPLDIGTLAKARINSPFLRWAGYLPSPQRFAPQSFHLATRNLSDSIPSNLLIRAEAWYVSIADHDAA